jgi:hypothetical protein
MRVRRTHQETSMASTKQQKASSRNPAQAAVNPLLASAEPASFAFAQEQMQSLMTLADVVLKRAEELRQWQLETAQNARRRHDRARADAASAASPGELLHVQSELLRDELESASQYWQRMATICTATQAEALEHMTRSAAQLGRLGGTVAGAQAPAETTSAQVGPREAAQAWNQWVDLGKQWSDMLYRTEAALH